MKQSSLIEWMAWVLTIAATLFFIGLAVERAEMQSRVECPGGRK